MYNVVGGGVVVERGCLCFGPCSALRLLSIFVTILKSREHCHVGPRDSLLVLGMQKKTAATVLKYTC